MYTNAEKMKIIREIMRLDTKAFASLLCVSVQSVYRWEKGMRQPERSKLALAEKYMTNKQLSELRDKTR